MPGEPSGRPSPDLPAGGAPPGGAPLEALLDLLADLAGRPRPELGPVRQSKLARWTGQSRTTRDDRELDLGERLWLVTRATSGSSLFLSEVHPLSRLIRSCDGLAFLAPPERVVVGVGLATSDLRVPSPAEARESLQRALDAEPGPTAAVSGDRSTRWRIQRLQRQSVRAAGNPRRWAQFCLRNDLGITTQVHLAVAIADGGRAVRCVEFASGVAHRATPAEVGQFWLSSPFGLFADAVQACGESAAKRAPAGGSYSGPKLPGSR